MAKATKVWDPAERLTTPEAIADYLDAALEDGDPKVIAAVLGDIARAKGMADVARTAGLSRESLYRALSESGNPSLATVLAVTKALGISLAVRAGEQQPDAA
ncbi:transcriptional regulator [Azospirillum baldaniorum]|nr:addiction module antidote protein [Azospirillum baldaniorum]AWJ88918.1 transcriptional regulator [Azospirillum baldaniorum]TWA73371.1 putative addiction module antidote protein [Azospirillum brasilense]